MNLANVAFAGVSTSEAATLSARGVISPLHEIGPFRPIPSYRSYAEIIEAELPRAMPTGVAVLDLERKLGGDANFNHLWYAGISRILLRDSLTVIRVVQGRILQAMWDALQRFCRPTSDYGGISRNVAELQSLERIYRIVLYPGESSAVVATVLCLTIGWGLWLASRARFNADNWAPGAALGVFLVLSVGWVTVAGNVLEFGENNRFRFAVDPLLVSVATAAVASVARYIVRRGEAGWAT
jgi:hypothetical protein